MTKDEFPPVHSIYMDYLENYTNKNLALSLWGKIPETMKKAYLELEKIRDQYCISSDIVGFQDALKKYHRNMGFLTRKVKKSIDNLGNGVVESGQQPNCLGGPSLLLNKMAYANSLCEIGKRGYVPVYYHADYDGVQAELINIRVPSPSRRGLLISYKIGTQYRNSPIYAIPIPDEDWLNDTIKKIKSNYKGMLKGINNRVQEKTLKNLEHIITIIKTAYYSTDNLSDFAAKILGVLVNIEADAGIPFVAPSIPEIRPFFQEGFELLLGEPNRNKFIEASNNAVRLIEEAGYKPQIGYRGKDYVPFFFECMRSNCNRARVELKYRRSGERTVIVGKCPSCNEEYEYSLNAKYPDLSEIINWISPRVDSRQVIADSVYPVLAHIGGPGETSYYAEVIPAIKSLNIPFPLFLRYTRTFYNTPWGERMGKSLKDYSYKTILNKILFEALGRWVKARSKDEAKKVAEAHRDIRESIMSSYNELLEDLETLNIDLNEIKQKLSTAQDHKLFGDFKKKQKKVNEIEHYLSLNYGRYSSEKFGQEVNWAWIDLALVSGVIDLFGVYSRIYNKYTPNNSMFFVNT